MVKQWNGLLQKEWIQWRGQIVVLVILLLAGLLILPSLAWFLLGVTSVFELTMIISFMAAGACVLVPVIAFLIMFNRDMKRPDLWLHSTASTTQLIGAKLFLAAGTGLAYLLVPVAVVAIRFLFASHPEVMFSELLFVGILLIGAIFLASIQFMVYGFFFVVIDHMLKPFLKGFSFVVTLLVFIISVRVYGEFTSSDFYEKYIQVGGFDLLAIRNPNIEIQYENFYFTNTILYAGEITFAIFFTIALFYLAITLFEKRVKL